MTAGAEPALSTEGATARRGRVTLPRELVEVLRLCAVLGCVVAGFSFAADRFLSLRTFQAIAQQIPPLLVASVGMTFVLVLGAIDLAMGSVLAFASALVGVLITRAGLPGPVAAGAGLAVGAAAGLASGSVVVRFRLPAFIVTLGMLEIARGGTYLVTASRTVYVGPAIERLAEAHVVGVPVPFLLAAAIVALGQGLLGRTVFGRHVVAVGTNEEVARIAGIDVGRIKRRTFALAGALTGLGAVLHTARLGAADPNAGIGFELAAIAAVVVGGTSLLGGRGSVVGTALGVTIIAALEAGLAQVGADEPVKRIVTGLVIVAAVVFDTARRR